MKTINELKQEFKLRNSGSTTLENIMTIPFFICLISSIFTLNFIWFIIAVAFAIVQRVLHSNNKAKFNVFLMDNQDEMYESDIEKYGLPRKTKPKLSHEEDRKLKISKNYWQCTCGQLNAPYITTCTCGMTEKQISMKKNEEKNKKIQEEQKKSELDNLNLLTKYKEMLDSGIISEEEFNEKKKELLKL